MICHQQKLYCRLGAVKQHFHFFVSHDPIKPEYDKKHEHFLYMKKRIEKTSKLFKKRSAYLSILERCYEVFSFDTSHSNTILQKTAIFILISAKNQNEGFVKLTFAFCEICWSTSFCC
jgi:hypothetical protein